ncbi:hypothetical protein OGAPHI_001304 [Ogataea philodendri]|uniref:Bromo domain-containing protein n=1 Tax=Ogataea philodendri TaxID=1378263 RepID=A0A9P8T8Y5_9ASCO|nr:uncharacterized protein OGAPHI_001304 [Ogataea philodendri]KAH3670788.1 hypothetical protein OGAPHI_001304 [Ogataea philodendri]
MVAKRRPGIILTLNNKKQKVSESGHSPAILPKESYFDILEKINGLIDEEFDTAIVGDFLKLPSKKLYPDYYQLIESPISISEIRSKIKKSDAYSTEDFLGDFKLMADNASTYNESQSYIAQNARKIYDFVEAEISEAISQAGANEGSRTKKKLKGKQVSTENEASSSYYNDLKNILKALVNYKLPTRGKLSVPFMDLVDGAMYPDYYEIIEEGMSFNLVKERIDEAYYTNDQAGFEKFKSDVRLIFKNAQTYNSEESLLYQDSVVLESVFDDKIAGFEASHFDSLENEEASNSGPSTSHKTSSRSKRTPIESDDRRGKSRSHKKKGYIESDDDEFEDEVEEDNEAEDFEEEAVEEEEEEEEDNDADQKKRGEEFRDKKHRGQLGVAIQNVKDKNAFVRAHTHSPENATYIKQFTISSSTKQYTQTNSEGYYSFTLKDPSVMNTFSLPSGIVGQPLDIFVSLTSAIINEKYIADLKVNNETTKPFPIAVSYDERSTDHDFLASRYEVKLGHGLNLVQFSVKVPESKKRDNHDEETKLRRRAATLSSANATNNGEDQNYETEHVKLWINVSQ